MPIELPKKVGGGATAVVEVGVHRTIKSAARNEGWQPTELRPGDRGPTVFNSAKQIEKSFELRLKIAIIEPI